MILPKKYGDPTETVCISSLQYHEEEKCKDMNIDHLRSNGHSNGHSAQFERKPKRVDYPRLLALGRELLLAIGEDPDREGLRETPRRWANAKVLGLSKFARIAQQFAHRLQLQERLGEQIADEISRITGTQHVAVVLKGEHYCMAARGIRSPARMTSSVMRGVFRTESQIRMEFLGLIE